MFRILTLFLLSLSSCGKQQSLPPTSQSPSILVTAAPYAYFVDKIGKGHLHIQILVPANANPHIYEPNPKQVEAILKTSLWFRLGESIEQKILTILQENNPHYLAIDLSKNIPAHYIQEADGHVCSNQHECHESIDRHFWLSPKLAAIQVSMISKVLIETYPQWASDFQQGSEEVLKELADLDRELHKELKPFEGQALLVSHPAFGYFCKEFQLKQLSVETEGKDPLPQDIAITLKDAENAKVRAVFLQAQYNNKGALLIAEKLQLPVYEVDPYALNYPENLRRIGNLISQPSLHTSIQE